MSIPTYAPDLNAISLDKLKERLKSIRLLSSQKPLLEDIDKRFAVLEQHGIENLAQLQDSLKTKSRLQKFAAKTALPPDYLTLLRREVNGFIPKPITLKDFPHINQDTVHRLEAVGIKTTAQLFPHVLNAPDRHIFAQQNQVDAQDLLILTKLTDVARLKWVGPLFARLLVESEFDTVEKILNADPGNLYRGILHTNAATRIYSGKFNQEDLAAWLETIQDTPRVIQY
jgi:hypothetical protein